MTRKAGTMATRLENESAGAPVPAAAGGTRPAAPVKKVTIPVSGMTCAACSSRVQRTLSQTPGVTDANVNLMLRNAVVQFDPAAISPDQLVETIRGTGYGAELATPGRTAFEEQAAQDQAQEEEFRELRLKAGVSF